MWALVAYICDLVRTTAYALQEGSYAIKKLGNPEIVIPRYVEIPLSQRSFTSTPSLFLRPSNE